MASSIQIEEIKPNKADERVTCHTHIKGLGLNKDGTPSNSISCGFVGQENAREAIGVLIELVKSKKLAGKAILLAGPPSTGKSALAIALSKELGSRVPFCFLSGSQVFSSEIKKSEVLTECFRRAIGVRIKEKKEIYEGEVIEICPVQTDTPLEGFGKTIVHVLLTLKTPRGSRQLKLDPLIYENIRKELIQVGDVIYIEGNSGSVKRVGRSDAFATEFDLEADEFVPVPKGNVHKQKDVVQDLSLHDLDAANARPEGGNDVMSLMNQISKPKKTEITEKLRREVNKVVENYLEKGIAEIVPGVLFIDEVHMLDAECFAFLNRALESPIAPVVVFATNRGRAHVRGTETIAPHGIPLDLLDRTVIVKTQSYTAEEILKIIEIRAKTEKIILSSDALAVLAHVALSASLRYAMQLLSPAKILSDHDGLDQVTKKHIEESKELFWDSTRSAQRLSEESKAFL